MEKVFRLEFEQEIELEENMINKKKITFAVGGTILASAITSTIHFARNNSSQNDEIIEKVNVTESGECVSAGVSSALTSSVETASFSLSAGASSALTDALTDATVFVNDDKIVVTAGKPEKIKEKNIGERCGYKNLAIAKLSGGNLNIRKKASTTSKAVGKMTKHNACEVLKRKGDWVKIKSGNVAGFVKAEYLVTGGEAQKLAEKEVIKVATVEGTQTLRIRKKASTKAETLSLIGEGEDLVVIKDDSKNGWLKVEADDNDKGYVSTEFVTISEKLPTAKGVKEVESGSNGITDIRASLVSYALQFVGNRYVWGGTSLTNGIDCSGFTMQIYARYGVGLPHHAASQPGCGKRISASQARPGDLFFYGSGGIHHVAIYIGNGQIVHAANARSGIKISSAYYSTPVCVVSYLN